LQGDELGAKLQELVTHFLHDVTAPAERRRETAGIKN
jgi:hypothetical protein